MKLQGCVGSVQDSCEVQGECTDCCDCLLVYCIGEVVESFKLILTFF